MPFHLLPEQLVCREARKTLQSLVFFESKKCFQNRTDSIQQFLIDFFPVKSISWDQKTTKTKSNNPFLTPNFLQTINHWRQSTQKSIFSLPFVAQKFQKTELLLRATFCSFFYPVFESKIQRIYRGMSFPKRSGAKVGTNLWHGRSTTANFFFTQNSQKKSQFLRFLLRFRVNNNIFFRQK